MTKKLIIVGAGGFGLEAAWVLESRGMADLAGTRLDLIGYADDKYKNFANANGDDGIWSIENALDGLSPKDVVFHCAIGSNAARERVVSRFLKKGFSPATLAHATAVIASKASVERGSYFGAYVVVAPEARIGEFALLNTHAAVGHHSQLGDFSQICPGAKISGNCFLGKRSFIGSNAVLIPNAKVSDDAVVGACSLVLRSVGPGQSVIGIPARRIGSRS